MPDVAPVVQGEAPAPERSMTDSLKRYLTEESGVPYQDTALEDAPAAEPAEVTEAPAAAAPEAPAVEEPPADEFAEVEIDGEKFKVPTKIKDGYLRQADYTKKTQEHAVTMEAATKFKAAAEQGYACINQFAPVVAAFFQEQQLADQYQRLDWDALKVNDPVRATELRLDALDNQRRLQNLGQQLQQAPAVLEALQEQAIAAETQRNLPRTMELVPDLDKRGPELFKVGLEKYGFTQKELRSITDPRIVVALRDLAEYQKLTVNRDAVRQQVQTLPPVARPGARTQTPQASGKELQAAVRALKTDRSDDAFVNALRLQRVVKG